MPRRGCGMRSGTVGCRCAAQEIRLTRTDIGRLPAARILRLLLPVAAGLALIACQTATYSPQLSSRSAQVPFMGGDKARQIIAIGRAVHWSGVTLDFSRRQQGAGGGQLRAVGGRLAGDKHQSCRYGQKQPHDPSRRQPSNISARQANLLCGAATAYRPRSHPTTAPSHRRTAPPRAPLATCSGSLVRLHPPALSS